MNCGCSRRIWKRSPDGRRHGLGRGLPPEERQTVLMLSDERLQDRSRPSFKL
jgi:hypothetical protein